MLYTIAQPKPRWPYFVSRLFIKQDRCGKKGKNCEGPDELVPLEDHADHFMCAGKE
jgi:hypothetical protein